MSMLEDLFLEDEAGEAQELERVLEGGGEEYDERPLSPTSDNNEERDDEAVEDKRRVDPGQRKDKRVIKNPRFVLNPARLTGPRGIQVIPGHFKDFKFKGKGHEKEDLDMVLKKLEHWAYRLYPKFAFHDCLKKIEMLGKKRPVMVHLRQIRSDQFVSEETVVQQDSSDDEAAPAQPPEPDEFDKLLQQQLDLARASPAPPTKPAPFATPSFDRSHIMPKATSSPSISDEQRERMLRNRQLAEERRLAKLRNDTSANAYSTPEKHVTATNTNDNNVVEIPDEVVVRKHNRSNVIDSSDEEDVSVVNHSVTVDVDIHNKVGDHIETVDYQKNDEGMDVEKNSNDNNTDNDFDKLIVTSEKNNLHVTSSNNTDQDEVLIDNLIESDNLIQYEPDNNKGNTNPKHTVVVQQSKNIIEEDAVIDNNSVANQVERNVVAENMDENDETKSNSLVNNNADIEKDNCVENGSKENIDSNITDHIMDVDFGDDF